MYQSKQLYKTNSSTGGGQLTMVQPKLKIGEPGDKYEQEADAVAEQVMRMGEGETMQMQPVEEEEEPIQMKCEKCEKEEMLQPESETGIGGYVSPEISQQIEMSNSGEGKHLLADLLSHTAQQGATLKPSIQKQDAGVATCPSATELNTLEANYRSMIADARSQGYSVAADNLEHWLTGGGTAVTLTTPWLRSFSSLVAAERVNQERFESSLNSVSNGMRSGSARTFHDYWDKQFTASVFEELYYASGTSTITSTGDFNLSRTGDTVAINGSVEHHWHDPYDWHAGLSAFIPGHGNISDSDELILERCRGASSFQMNGDWTQTLSGTIDIGYIWNTKTFTWTGP